MKRIYELGDKIRDYVNTKNLYDIYYKDNLDDWMKLCVSMDILRDTCNALRYFEESGFGKDVGETYLKLYGFFQAIFLQQDAIRGLHSVITKSEFKKDENSSWSNIRELRNIIVGHPIEKKTDKTTKRTVPVQAFMSNDEFMIASWDKVKMVEEFIQIKIKVTYEQYKIDAEKQLENIYDHQIKRWGEIMDTGNWVLHNHPQK